MSINQPAPSSAPSGAPSPAKGEGKVEKKEEKTRSNSSPSPLAGEGARRADEGALNRTLKFAKKLRKDMTDVERKLWSALRDRRFEDFKFRRQVPIGKYIVDFLCLEKRLIVELDGSQHEGSEHDELRDAWLRSQDFRVLRFWNIDINQALDGTLLAILDSLNQTLIRRFAPPSPARGEGRKNENL